jgi:hypothetical protein
MLSMASRLEVSQTNTLAPFAANVRTISLPMPDAPAVTRRLTRRR